MKHHHLILSQITSRLTGYTRAWPARREMSRFPSRPQHPQQAISGSPQTPPAAPSSPTSSRRGT